MGTALCREWGAKRPQVFSSAAKIDQRFGGGIAGLVQLAKALVEQRRFQVFEQAWLAMHTQQLLQLGIVGVGPQP